MAKIKINAEAPLYNGMPVTFKAPCDCSIVDGLSVQYGEDKQQFVFTDAHGNELTGIGNLFGKDAIVKAVLDTDKGRAFVQNADTNAYLEERLSKTVTSVNGQRGDVIITAQRIGAAGCEQREIDVTYEKQTGGSIAEPIWTVLDTVKGTLYVSGNHFILKATICLTGGNVSYSINAGNLPRGSKIIGLYCRDVDFTMLEYTTDTRIYIYESGFSNYYTLYFWGVIEGEGSGSGGGGAEEPDWVQELIETAQRAEETANEALDLSEQNAAEIETLKQSGGGGGGGGGGTGAVTTIPPMFEKIGVWHWENIDMRLDPSYSPAVGNAGSIGMELEVDLGNGWTIINPYRSTDPAPTNTRIARYTFPDGKAYKKVIAMMSFDPNFIPSGYITDLEKSRGFKEGAEYGQKSAGDPVHSSVRFIGDMGGTGTLLKIDSHNKDSQGFVKVFLTKEEGLWTLTRTERTDNTGNRSDLRHYQSGFYGSYDVAQPVYHESPHDADNLGSYERITGFEFETILPWYDTDNSGSGDKLNNLRGMLCLYGVPEDDPETVYGLKFHNITVREEYYGADLQVTCRTKQYENGVVCATVTAAQSVPTSLGVTVKTASGRSIDRTITYHTDASHHGVTRGYITFDMPDEDVVITLCPAS